MHLLECIVQQNCDFGVILWGRQKRWANAHCLRTRHVRVRSPDHICAAARGKPHLPEALKQRFQVVAVSLRVFVFIFFAVTCRGTCARVTIDQIRHSALQTC